MINKKNLILIFVVAGLILTFIVAYSFKKEIIICQKHNDKIEVNKYDEKNFIRHQEKAEKTIYLEIIDGINKKGLFSGSIDIEKNNNLSYIMKNFLQTKEVKYIINNDKISMMYNLFGETKGEKDSWFCYVNGEKISKDIKDYFVKIGDRITWKYVNYE